MLHDIIISMVCSKNYLKKAFSLINSIEDNSKLNYKIHLHLISINPTSIPALVYKFKVNTDRIEIFYDFPELVSASKPLRVNPVFGGNIYTRFSAYCANSRVLDFKKLLDRGEQRILYMDVDSIVRSSLVGLSNIIDNNDLSIHLRQCMDFPIHSYKMLNPGGCAAGIIGIRNTKESVKFVDMWVDLLMSEERLLHWYSEQNTANHLIVNSQYDMEKIISAGHKKFLASRGDFVRREPSIKIYNLEQKFIDWNFDSKSPIWVGKGNKKGFKKYLKEESSYLRQK